MRNSEEEGKDEEMKEENEENLKGKKNLSSLIIK